MGFGRRAWSGMQAETSVGGVRAARGWRTVVVALSGAAAMAACGQADATLPVARPLMTGAQPEAPAEPAPQEMTRPASVL